MPAGAVSALLLLLLACPYICNASSQIQSLEEAYTECFIIVSDKSRWGMQSYYKCGGWKHIFSDPLFRGPKEAAREFEICFMAKAAERLQIDALTFEQKYDVEGTIRELKCNPTLPVESPPQAPLSIIHRAVAQFHQRFQKQFAEMASKVKPEWFECFNEQRNVTLGEFFCEKSHEAMNSFRHCVSESFQPGTNGQSAQEQPIVSNAQGRLQKIANWIIEKVICKPEIAFRSSRHKRGSSSDGLTQQTFAKFAAVIGPIPAIILMTLMGAFAFTTFAVYSPFWAGVLLVAVCAPLLFEQTDGVFKI